MENVEVKICSKLPVDIYLSHRNIKQCLVFGLLFIGCNEEKQSTAQESVDRTVSMSNGDAPTSSPSSMMTQPTSPNMMDRTENVNDEVMDPRQVLPPRFSSLSLGYEHACGINSGTSQCWGRNQFKQSDVPDIELLNISVGRFHSCALDTLGNGHCWGKGDEGQLQVPEQTFSKIQAGWRDSCGLSTEGELVCWGEQDEFDPPPTLSVDIIDLSLGKRYGCVLKEDHLPQCWGTNDRGQASPINQPFTKIYASLGAHTCALNDDGIAQCWGDPTNGRTLPPQDTRFTDLALGSDHSCGLSVDQKVYCWGNDLLGQSDAPEGRFTSIHAGDGYSCAHSIDGTLSCWGSISVPVLPLFQDISVGDAHACGVLVDGSLDCWGWPRGGRLLAPEGSFTQVSVGSDHGCALNEDKAIQCWGVGVDPNRFERDGDYDQADPPPPPSEGGITFQQISVGSTHSCALSEEGRIRCWGDQRNGKTSPPAGLWTHLSAGGEHTCALNGDGDVYCWGKADGNRLNVPSKKFSGISAGFNHTCAIEVDTDRIYCWGVDVPIWSDRVEINDTTQEKSADDRLAGGSNGEMMAGAQGGSYGGADGGIMTEMEGGSDGGANGGMMAGAQGGAISQTIDDVLGGSEDAFNALPSRPLVRQLSVGKDVTCWIDTNGLGHCYQDELTPTDDILRLISTGQKSFCAIKNDLQILCMGQLFLP